MNLFIATKGKIPVRLPWHRQDEREMFIGKTKDKYPKPDGKYIFDKLSSVYISGNATRDDAPNHIRVQTDVPREVAETWQWMCPAGVYEIPEDAPEEGNVDVIVNYTNCVQCGAITAKGGRSDDARGRRRASVPEHLGLSPRCRGPGRCGHPLARRDGGSLGQGRPVPAPS